MAGNFFLQTTLNESVGALILKLRHNHENDNDGYDYEKNKIVNEMKTVFSEKEEKKFLKSSRSEEMRSELV